MKSHPAVYASVSISFTKFGMSKTCCPYPLPTLYGQKAAIRDIEQRHHTTQFYLYLYLHS